MIMGLVEEVFGVEKPIIGMIHLKPLPGTPGSAKLRDVLDLALKDAENLVEGGVDGLLIENLFDSPFYPDKVPPHVISSMTMIAWEIRKRYDLPIGVNILRNDSEASLAVASTIGAKFIRVNVHIGCVVTDQGIIQG
ncbi:MAG: phosphorybosylanthranilate isomerase, partial [Thaumarchaeota archaeon]